MKRDTLLLYALLCVIVEAEMHMLSPFEKTGVAGSSVGRGQKSSQNLSPFPAFPLS